ncbi:hypothetical protein ACKWTF_009257 [Chironomus riparius]
MVSSVFLKQCCSNFFEPWHTLGNVQKQRKIIIMFNGEKREILFNENDKSSGSKKSSSSKRKSSDRSSSPTKRKKSSERSLSTSKHISSKEDKPIHESHTVTKHKNSEKASSSSSTEKSSKTEKKSLSEHKSSSSKHKSAKRDKSLNKNASKSEIKESENSSTSSKHRSSSKHKCTESTHSIQTFSSEKEQKSSTSSKSKENSLDKSSSSETKQKLSTSISKQKSSSFSTSKSCELSEKLSSPQSNCDKSRNESKERKSKSKSKNDIINQEIQKIREENTKFLSEMIEKFRDETKKFIEDFSKNPPPLVKGLNSVHLKSYNLLDCNDEIPVLDIPSQDNDYEYILINGYYVRKCVLDYYMDPINSAQIYSEKGKDYESECTNMPKIDETLEQQNGEKMAILVPNTEIPLHEINGIQHNSSNENIQMMSIKTEVMDVDEILTKPVSIFHPSTTVEPPDSKLNISFTNIKSELQPHCSKNIPPNNIKQELSIDSKEYFRIIPQNTTNTEVPAIKDSEKLKSLADMTVINKWIASQNNNHGFKDKETLNFMMLKNSLFSLFKCMGINCCYTTISYENFLDHLNIHMDSNCSTKDCFLNCAYCLNISKDPIDLIEHYKKIHFNCIYQCNLCFYRAAEQQSVYDHQVHYHSQDTRKHEILECPSVYPKDEKIEEHKIINKIKEIKECLICELCFDKFIIPEDYIKHLKSDHQSVEEKDKSEEEIKKMNISFANNRIGKYQCIECESTKPFGSNNRIEMRTHLHQHPRTLHYVCVRETEQYKHTRIKSRGDLQVTKYNGDLEVLRNTEGILKITTM